MNIDPMKNKIFREKQLERLSFVKPKLWDLGISIRLEKNKRFSLFDFNLSPIDPERTYGIDDLEAIFERIRQTERETGDFDMKEILADLRKTAALTHSERITLDGFDSGVV